MEILERNKRDLPNATLILILGILSLVFCWCYGILGLILGIIAVVLANTAKQAYLNDPDAYTETSFKNVNTGRICGIVAICLSTVVFVVALLVLFGAIAIGIGALSCGL